MKTFKTTLLTIAVLLCSISMKAKYPYPDFRVNGINYNITSSSERTVEVSWYSCEINDSGTVYERYYFNISYSYYGNIVIPENVTYEGETYTVTSIAEGAFYKCPKLISITIPKTVTNIERINHETGDVGAAGIFFGCTGLAEIVIEEGNPIYDSRNNCNAIIETNTNTLIEGCKNTIIPNTIKNIGEHAFYKCTNITSIFIPNSVEKIGNNAFEGCRIKDLTIPNSVKDLGHETFANNALVNIVVGDSVTKIGGYTFYGNTGIQSLVIGKSVTTISDDSFYHKVKGRIINLSTLSKSVINDNVADDYVQIINVDNQKYELYGDWIFRCSDDYQNFYLTAYIGNEKDFTLPESFYGKKYDIDRYAFIGRDFESLTIPDFVTEIGHNSFSTTNLTQITIPNSVKYINSNAFKSCRNLTKVIFGKSVEKIGNNNDAFYDCENLDTVINFSNLFIGSDGDVEIPAKKIINADEQIDKFFFKTKSDKHYLNGYIGNEQNVTLPANYKNENYTIGISAFSDCDSLVNIVIPNSVTNIEDKAFAYCDNIIDITIPSSTISIGNQAFYDCKNLKNVNLGESITNIGDEAFWGCIELTDITIPNSVISIGDGVFENCKKMKSLILGESVLQIGNASFYNCEELTDIIIPNSVMNIGSKIFSGCKKLKSVTLGDAVSQISDDAFRGCIELVDIIIPNSVKNIETAAFQGCSNLANVVMGNSVLTIRENAFSDCENLKCITIATLSPPYFGESNFENNKYRTIIIKVPEGTLASYQTADGWKKFWNIQEDPVLSIDATILDTEDTTAPIYNLQGVRMKESKEHLPAGIYIQGGKKMIVR